METIYKRNLLSNDEILQFETIKLISKLISKIMDQRVQRAYSNTLIDMEIAWILCHFVGVSNKEVLSPTLLILQVMSDCDEFYTKNVARRAFTHILKAGDQLTKSNEDVHQSLLRISNTLSTFINRAGHRQIPLKTICNIESLLEFIKELNLSDIRHPLYTLAVTNLYAAFISTLDKIQEDKNFNIIVKVYCDILEAANKTMPNLIVDGDMRCEDMMRPITIICNAGMRLYQNRVRSNAVMEAAVDWADLNPAVNSLDPILEITYKTLRENVIPNSTTIDVTTELDSVSSVNFTDCLCALYKCEDITLDDISWQLAESGYLKYFHAVLRGSKPHHEGLCDMLAQITVLLSRKYLSMDEWSDGPQEFRKFIKIGLMTLTHSESNNSSPKDASLFLIFIHLRATKIFNFDDYINAVTKLDMSRRIMDISIDVLPEIPTLQVILFLFAASILGRPTEHLDQLFYAALPHITEIVAKVGLENCCTDTSGIPLLILEGSVLPEELPSTIVKIWLKFDDDIYLYLIRGTKHTLIDCLLNIVHSEEEEFLLRCSWKLLRTLNACVKSELSISEQMIQSMWGNYVEILTIYTKERETSTEHYLEALNRMIVLKLLELPIMIECTKAIIQMLLRGDVEISAKIQTLITHHAAQILTAALSSHDDQVLWLFVRNYSVLEKLCNLGFNKEHEDLAASSFECLAAILRGQIEFRMECFTPFILSRSSLFGPLMPRQSSYYDVLDFYDKVWTGEMRRPAVVIAPHTLIQMRETLVAIYQMYCVIHMNNQESQWECTFHCMANFLQYLRKHNKPALAECCEYICNSQITTTAVEVKCYNSRFFDFASVWLRQSLKRRTRSVRCALQSRKHRHEMKERIFYESPFLKAIYDLNHHMRKAVECEYVEKHKVAALKHYLKKLL